ncbi:hypothetical protein KFK09_017730 [Dendrobium nobile]|uniref:Reverse transcriptase domain-containing protein n=1 Tax=Dendrobium nobile TaxID=94219 RepID=A0A8T3ASB3_DENNO|nr:hypothetical protein KFK09_017730 [Dendrobium nobile]
MEGWPNPSHLISSEDQRLLEADFTREELQLVVANSERNISPGLDGITFSFMKDFWNVIKDDMWAAVFHVLSSCNMDQLWKETLIVLISKIKLEKIIHKLISVDQAAFIKGRSLSDHVLVAQEIFNKFRWSKAKGGLLAIKLDMEQAYDNMGWDALRKVLIRFNFRPKFRELLLSCVLNPKFCILINGKKTDWIEGKINKGISVARLAPKVSHLLFADDILIFSEAKVKEVKELRRIINNYCDWTSQMVNQTKSMILFGKNTRKRVQKKMMKILKFKKLKEINYLGIKMALRRLKTVDFQNLLEAAASRLNTWGTKNISLEGRIVLIILNIPIDNRRQVDQIELLQKFSGRSITALASSASMNHEELLHWDSSHLEMLAVLYLKNVIQEWMFEAQGVIIEGDNVNIIKLFHEITKLNGPPNTMGWERSITNSHCLSLALSSIEKGLRIFINKF